MPNENKNEGEWPLSMAHLENSKYAPSTLHWQTSSIEAFQMDQDAILEAAEARRVYPGAPRFPLKEGLWPSTLTLEKALRKRRTVRSFSPRAVSWSLLSRLLRSSAGVTGGMPVEGSQGVVQRFRAWPSAGGLYPVEIYPVLFEGPRQGVYHYVPFDACLEQLAKTPPKDEIRKNILSGQSEIEAPLLLVLTGVPGRTLQKYGERGYRFLLMEIGHVAQNILLTATALGLGACPIGGFYEDRLLETLGIERKETVLYVIALGHSRK